MRAEEIAKLILEIVESQKIRKKEDLKNEKVLKV